MRHIVRNLAISLVLVLLATVPAGGQAAPRAAAAAPTVNVTGTWVVITTDPMYSSFTLNLVQAGAVLVEYSSQGVSLIGSVVGTQVPFCLLCNLSEDAYGGQGAVGPLGKGMAGRFWDGFGFVGSFKAVKIR